MDLSALPYISRQSKYRAFGRLLRKDWAMLLDSGSSIEQSNGSKAESYRRYDILVYQPSVRLTFDKGNTTVEKWVEDEFEDELIHTNSKDQSPLQIMRELLSQYAEFYSDESFEQSKQSKQSEHAVAELPFNGGWIGYISYDFGLHQELYNDQEQLNKLADSPKVAEIKMGLYQWALITDHRQETTKIYNFGLDATTFSFLIQTIKKEVDRSDNEPSNTDKNKNGFELACKFQSNITAEDYAKGFNKIQDYITAGDCYQVNFAQQFRAKFSGCSFEVYQILAEANNAPFSAYLNFASQQIMSHSPERFIESHQGLIKTQPIKGTRPRNKDPILDSELAKELTNSDKDKAENLMIVDLLRNDLSKTASKGSVQVTELFGLYHFESVHHLISTVTSKLKTGLDNFDLLSTTLPGGSITGAPKIRAMQIIDELEDFERGIYCGVIGYLDFKRNMDTNICIRTLLVENETLYCCAGGGIVSDSKLQLEYQETFDKLNKILPVLEQFYKPEQEFDVSG